MRRETLIDLLSGELSEEEALAVEQHLAECPACRTEVNALGRLTHPFLSEESWQPDATMADRVLVRARADGWAASGTGPNAPATGVSSGAAEASAEPSSDPCRLSDAASSTADPARQRRSARLSSLPDWLSWFARPLPSYAAVGLAVLALAAGIILGGGAGRLSPRNLPTEAGKPVPAPSSPYVQPGRSPDRPTEPLASQPARGDSGLRVSASTRRGAGPVHNPATSRPIAFVAVYTDAMRLSTPGERDSL